MPELSRRGFKDPRDDLAPATGTKELAGVDDDRRRKSRRGIGAQAIRLSGQVCVSIECSRLAAPVDHPRDFNSGYAALTSMDTEVTTPARHAR